MAQTASETKSRSRISNVTKIKLVITVILLVLVGIVIWQNWQDVETNIFWITVTMPQAILLFLMLAIGFVIGFVTARLYRRR